MQTGLRQDLSEKASALNEKLASESAEDILDHCCNQVFSGRIGLISSFGAESAVLLSLAMKVRSDLPVIFLDTHKHFSETLEYVSTLRDSLSIETLTITRPRGAEIEALDAHGLLHQTDSDSCCHIRKTLPMVRALNPYDAWITGRKRFQTANREQLEIVEVQEGWLKINPLAAWAASDVFAYAKELNLPPHPLVAHGFRSIGCEPCTVAVSADGDSRAGRWQDQDKTECGIHIVDGKVIRERKSSS